MSAVAVCAGHLRSATMVDYAAVESPSIWLKLFYFCTSLGTQSVLVFFVLSGFFVGGTVLRKADRFDWLDYLINRLSRLRIVLIPALLLTWLADSWVWQHSPDVIRGDYQELWQSGPQGDQYSTSIGTLLGNVFFLQTIVTPTFGSNLPLWSLAAEFWFYFIFPVLLTAAAIWRRPTGLAARLGSIAVAAALFYWLPEAFAAGFTIWLLGVLVWLCSSRLLIKPRPVAVSGSLLVFLGGLLYSESGNLQARFAIPLDLVIGCSFAVFCLFVAAAPDRRIAQSPAIDRLVRGLSECSYSLYLSHFPLIMVLISLIGPQQSVPDAGGMARYFLQLLGLLCCGYAFWFCFERHTQWLKDALKSRFSRRRS